MRTVFFISSDNYQKARNMVYGDDIISRQTINFRECRTLGFDKDGYYLEINGSEEAVKKLKELLGSLCKELDNNEKNEVLKKIDEQEKNAEAGFGALFG
ncbi:MAG: hypothetical protein J7K72_04500 [Candidatus Aenigmarchaeota archaeon]|nr:hypothetical protein [Candidatus Aenigmarchaeota archaeon]